MNTELDTAAEFADEYKPNDIVVKPRSTMTIRDTESTSFLDPNLYMQMKALAQDFINSKAIPSVWTSASQVLVGLQTGVEMGMKPMEAMNSLYVVNGAINVWGKATLRRLKEHGWTVSYKETPTTCQATVTKGEESYTETFDFIDAEKSGYTKDGSGRLKIGWREGMNRKKKLRYGVISLIISTYIPEVLGSAMGIVEVSEDFESPSIAKISAEEKKVKLLEKLNEDN